ncbi:hypothetical protein RJT34_29505 [Clitoria ternatea]|uniref:Uncharacterized protein n=1 Tax=Clitoria ternatea TaxID=43366 RepID=A0AAN9FA13_CLITE
MDGRELSKKLQQHLQPFGEHYTSPYFSYPSFNLFIPNDQTHFSKFCPMFSSMEFSAHLIQSQGYQNMDGQKQDFYPLAKQNLKVPRMIYENNTDNWMMCHFHTWITKEILDELQNAGGKVNPGNANSFAPCEDSCEDHSCAKSDRDSSSEAGGDASDDEVNSDELLFDEKTMKKIELLAAMVGVDTTDPAVVLNEVVKVLKVLKRVN